MNWEKIKETKAYEEWIDFYPYNWDEFTLKEAYPFENLIGWLFRFFDERGIIVLPDFEYEENKWAFIIQNEPKGIYGRILFDYPDRPSALKEGFERAFEILENISIKST